MKQEKMIVSESGKPAHEAQFETQAVRGKGFLTHEVKAYSEP